MPTYRVIEFESKKYLDTLVDRTYLLTKDDAAIARFTTVSEAESIRNTLNGGALTEPPTGEKARNFSIDMSKLFGFASATTLHGVSYSVGGFAPAQIDGYVYAVAFDLAAAEGIRALWNENDLADAV